MPAVYLLDTNFIWKWKIGLWLIVAWAAVVLGAIPPAGADYAGPVHSDEQIKQLMEYRGPRTNPVLLRVWQTEFLGERFNRAIAVSQGGAYRVNWGGGNSRMRPLTPYEIAEIEPEAIARSMPRICK